MSHSSGKTLEDYELLHSAGLMERANERYQQARTRGNAAVVALTWLGRGGLVPLLCVACGNTPACYRETGRTLCDSCYRRLK